MKTPKRLAAMVEEGLVDEVIGQLMNGKEANQRSFRNNASYQEGRKVKNSHQARAMEKGSRYRRKMQKEVWQNAPKSMPCVVCRLPGYAFRNRISVSKVCC